MFRRDLQAIKLLVSLIGASAVIWALSWLGQYICAVTIAGQHFRITDHAANRLAAITVAMVFVAMLIVFLMNWVRGWPRLLGIIALTIASLPLASVILAVFAGTTVSTLLAQAVYYTATLLLGVFGWAIFLEDIGKT